MRLLSLLAAVVVAHSFALAAPAGAAFLSETAYDFGTRGIGNYFTLPPFGSRTYTLNDQSTVLSAGGDARTNSYGDIGLRFALGSAITPQATILSATLTFAVNQSDTATGTTGPITLQVSGTAAGAGNLALSDFDTSTSVSKGNGNIGTATFPANIPNYLMPYTFDVTSLLQGFSAAGAATVFVQIDNLTGQSGFTIASQPYANPANYPTLTITYAAAVPEPASAVLVAYGVAVAMAAGRHLRARRAGA